MALCLIGSTALADGPRTPADKLTNIIEHTYVNSPVAQAKTEQRVMMEDQSPPTWLGVSVATFKQPMHQGPTLDVRTVVNTSHAAGIELAWMW